MCSERDFYVRVSISRGGEEMVTWKDDRRQSKQTHKPTVSYILFLHLRAGFVNNASKHVHSLMALRQRITVLEVCLLSGVSYQSIFTSLRSHGATTNIYEELYSVQVLSSFL